MARKRIKKHEIFWGITGLCFVWLLVIVGIKVWHIAHEPDQAIKEEQRHRVSVKQNSPTVDDAVKDTAYNLNNIKEGKFTEKAKWPKPPERKTVLVPVNNGDEKPPQKDVTNSYYGDGK